VSEIDDDPEATAAFAVLDRLGRFGGPDDTSVPEPDDAVEEVLRRIYGEATALLPYALPPATPPAALRGRLLTAIVGDRTQEVDDLVASPAPPAAPVAPAPPVAPTPWRGSQRVRRRRWPARLAVAATVVAASALGLWSLYLVSELRAARVRLAWAEREWKADAERQRAELARLESAFEHVTAAAVTIYPLRCPTGRGPAANARVYLYVPPDRSQWELAVHGLAPEPPGRDYQLWFLVGDRPQSAGCFHVEAGRAVVATPATPPPGVTGVAVTLEPKGGSPRPTGEMILVAHQPIRL